MEVPPQQNKHKRRSAMVHVDVLEQLPIFAGMDRDALQDIAQACNVRSYKGAEYVLREGKPAQHFYILLRGRIAIERRIRPTWLHAEGIFDAVIHHLQETEVFGWSAFLEPGILTASAHCLENSEVLEIGGKQLMDILDAPKNSHSGYLFMKRLASVIAHRFSETAERLMREIEEVETYKAT